MLTLVLSTFLAALHFDVIHGHRPSVKQNMQLRIRSRVPTISQGLDSLCAYIFLFSVIVVIVRFHHLERHDSRKCLSTLAQGRWLDPPDPDTDAHTFTNWQAPGCLLRKYRAKDILACLSEQQIVYIGDSTVRQLYWATARKLDAEYDTFFTDRASC